MSRPRSERSRWVCVYRIPRPGTLGEAAQRAHDEALVIVAAFAKVGRVVRVERDDCNGFVLKARRA